MLTSLSIIIATVLGVAEVPSPRARDAWVADTAAVIDDAAEARLEGAIEALHSRTGAEIVVVTADQISDSPKAFATALFAHWQLGDPARNDGLLVLLVMGERRLEMEPGLGLEAVLDADWLLAMQQRDIIPRFKQGDFGAGLEAGVTAVVERLANNFEAPSPGVAGTYRSDRPVEPAPARAVENGPAAVAPEQRSPPARDSGSSPWIPLGGAGVVGLAGFGAWAMRRRWWRRMKTCEQCQQTMLQLDEIADDAKLEPGERKEEEIGSIDYRVLVCPGCQWSRTLPRNRWFSGYRRCTGCSYKTGKRSSRTVIHATYDHGGQVEVTETCVNCPHHAVSRHATARRTRPSTTSTSGRSSFGSSSGSRSSSSRSSGGGGGRSSGGGAGSSW